MLNVCPLFAFHVAPMFLFIFYLLQFLSGFHFTLISNDRGTQKKFPRLFFINYVRDQGGKHQNLIKCTAKEIVSLMLSVFCVDLVGGVRAEKLGG
jgi:hypothetical protein